MNRGYRYPGDEYPLGFLLLPFAGGLVLLAVMFLIEVI